MHLFSVRVLLAALLAFLGSAVAHCQVTFNVSTTQTQTYPADDAAIRVAYEIQSATMTDVDKALTGQDVKAINDFVNSYSGAAHKPENFPPVVACTSTDKCSMSKAWILHVEPSVVGSALMGLLETKATLIGAPTYSSKPNDAALPALLDSALQALDPAALVIQKDLKFTARALLAVDPSTSVTNEIESLTGYVLIVTTITVVGNYRFS
jgi:hypothetical protein